MIIVVAALGFANQQDRDRAVALTADVQMATRVEERGCRDYCFAPDPSVPTRIQVYELWDDSDSLAAHFTAQELPEDGRAALFGEHQVERQPGVSGRAR